MKIILKPLGVLSVAAVVASLSFLALRQNKSAAVPPTATSHPWAINPVAANAATTVLPDVIYDDSLQNGWENYSWAKTNNFADTDQVQQGHCIQIRPEPFEALYFHHAPMSVAQYDRITFRIRGDKATTEQLKIIAQLDAEANIPTASTEKTPTAATLPTVAASPALTNKPVVDALVMLTPTPNKWKTVVIPLKELAVEGKTNLIGFWLQETVGNKVASTFYVDDVRLLRPTDPAPAD